MIRDESAFQPQEVIVTTGSASMEPVRSGEALKKHLLGEKIRTENRERKKRWREQNEDRNKDNDLRCRVNKRARILFPTDGLNETERKSRWVEEEFEKRQLKRKEKERRKNPNATVSAVSAVATTSTITTTRTNASSGRTAEAAAAAAAADWRPVNMESLSDSVKFSPNNSNSHTNTTDVSLSERLAIHHQAHQVQQQAERAQQEFQATQLAHAQFDVTTFKTALVLNDLVKKNGSHLDLAQLTGVLTDPNLARQLIEIEAQNPVPPPSVLMIMNNMPPVRSDKVKTNHLLEADYPMDAILTLMQLNGSWKA
ncbi:hypothetical protein BGZ65_007974 [Modicella reniformis]|uniref:DUF3020 domain-containing protein n=1 Tax=Modicella reniformis TaxID=1440133 RepID=A0A9P6JGS9_9FUNG|nr:hypothetical protein BGZ65_007974 [Modicella reniformis]